MTTVTISEKASGNHILVSPLWVLIVRGAQVLLSLICLAIAGNLLASTYLDELGLNVAAGVLTWLIVAYIVLSEKIPSLQVAYHIIAVMSLDAFLIVLWLATFASTAARRGVVPSLDCVGSFCAKKRYIYFAWNSSGLARLSATAGIGALVWLLFVATGVWTVIMFFKARKEGHFQFQFGGANTTTAEYQLENKGQQPVAGAPATFQPVQQQAPQGQYPQGPCDPAQSPYPQQQPYAAPPQDQYAQGQYPPQGQYAPQDQQAYAQYPPQPYQQPASPEPVTQNYQGQPPAAAPSHPQQ